MRILILAALAGLAAGCATHPTYQARSESSRYGYAETLVQPNRIRVSYNGDTMTPRETVQTYLLYRAAETTLQHGYDYFVIVGSDADEDTRVEMMGRPRFGGISYREISAHNATVEIVMFQGEEAPPIANIYDARQVQQTLESHVITGASQ